MKKPEEVYFNHTEEGIDSTILKYFKLGLPLIPYEKKKAIFNFVRALIREEAQEDTLAKMDLND
ncbi:MAG: hypothetical protein HUJ62_04630 [Streptococcus gallolyticus]|nr:hypothetical protein [Streptococcus gallolyticus]